MPFNQIDNLLNKKFTKNVYGFIFFFGSILLSFAIISYIVSLEGKLTKIVTVTQLPVYGHYSTTGRNSKTIYYVQFHFKELADTLLMSSLNYQFANHVALKNDVGIGSKLKVVYRDYEISELYRDERNYIDTVSRDMYANDQIKLLFGSLFFGLVVSIIILLSKFFLPPEVYFIVMKYAAAIIISLLLLAFFIAKQKLNFEFHSANWVKNF